MEKVIAVRDLWNGNTTFCTADEVNDMEKVEVMTGPSQVIRSGAADLTTLRVLPVGSRIRLCGLSNQESFWLGMHPPLGVDIKHVPNTFYCDQGKDTIVRQHYLTDFGLIPYNLTPLRWNQVNWIEVVEIRI
jgi:hypothetical protein